MKPCRALPGLALLILLGAQPAMAQAPSANVDLAEEADLHFQQAIDHYRAGRFEKALEHLLRSNRLVPNRNVAFNIARCYEQLGRFDEAFRHYHDVLSAEPDPKGQANAREAIARIQPRVALIEVETDPPGAQVFIDRQDLGSRGTSPRTLALPPGPHTVIVTLDGYESARVGPMTLETGARKKATMKLDRILGAVTVRGQPAGATVRVDGQGEVLGTVPGEIALPPGQHVLLVESPGWEAARVPVEVRERETTAAEVALRLITGQVVVDADEAGALIEIDGQARGFTPEVLPDIPVGPHRVAVRLAGYAPYEVEIDVDADAERHVFAELRPLNQVVGASRTVESLDDAPASVTLISGQEIRAFGYETLYDALQGTRGVFPSDDRSYAALGIRGFARAGDYGNRLLVTVDGHTLNDDQLGSSYLQRDFSADLGDVARIELVRGPGSALYGTNAFFGVINVVTHDAETLPAPHIELAHGGPREIRGRGSVGFTQGADAGFWLSAGAARGQGEDVLLRDFAGGGDLAITDADDVTSGSVSGKGWWGDLTLQMHLVARDKRIPTGAYETIPGDPRAANEDRRGFVELRYEPELGGGVRLLSRAYVDGYQFRGGYPYDDAEVGVVRDTWNGIWVGAEARAVGQLGGALRYTVGAEARASVLAELQSEDESGIYLDEEPAVQVFSGYAVIDWRIIDPITLTLGGRADHFSTFGAEFSPRATLVLRPSKDDVVKLIAGRAFRAPSPYELQYNDGGTTQIAADDLAPETVLTTELEYARQLPDELRLIIGGFFNRVEDLVELDLAADGELLQYQNVPQQVDAAGAEIELRREWRRGWFLSGSYSYQRARLGDVVDGERLTNSPNHLIALKAAAPLGRTGATVANRLRVESPRRTRTGGETEPAVLWDVTVTGEVPGARLTYGLGVRNLLDWRHGHATGEDIDSGQVPQIGRLLYGTARVSF